MDGDGDVEAGVSMLMTVSIGLASWGRQQSSALGAQLCGHGVLRAATAVGSAAGGFGGGK